jgi:hypothetical protein
MSPHPGSAPFKIIADLRISSTIPRPSSPMLLRDRKLRGERSRLRNFQVSADFLGEEFNDLAMPRDRRRFLRAPINVNRVIAAFAQKFATVSLEMAQ